MLEVVVPWLNIVLLLEEYALCFLLLWLQILQSSLTLWCMDQSRKELSSQSHSELLLNHRQREKSLCSLAHWMGLPQVCMVMHAKTITIARFTLQHLERAWPSKWGQSCYNLQCKRLQKWAWPFYFVLPLWVKPSTGQSHAKSIPC